jgi:hypothetical protein
MLFSVRRLEDVLGEEREWLKLVMILNDVKAAYTV